MQHNRKPLRAGLAAFSLLTAVVVLAGFGGQGYATVKKTGAFKKTYRDDFSSGHRWPEKRSATADYGVVGKKEKAYGIMLKKAPWFVFAQPIDMFGPIESGVIRIADSRQKVDVGTTQKGEHPTMGLLCRWDRHLRSISAYAFHISFREGPRWTIARFVGGKPKLLKSGRGNFGLKTWNHLEATCTGNTLTFKVNERQVAEVHDSALKTGLNALLGVAVSTQKAPLLALYDNYELSY